MNERKPAFGTNICIAIFYLVPAGAARAGVPAPLQVVEVLPGLTLGGIYATRYGGDDPMSEFGIFSAYANHGDKNGYYVSEIFSDAGTARGCCRDATFKWYVDERRLSLDVAVEGSPYAGIGVRPLVRDVPVKTGFPIICVKEGNVVFLQNRYISKASIAATDVKFPEGSPLSGSLRGLKFLSTYWDVSNIVRREREFIHKRATAINASDVYGSTFGTHHKE